jgi:hypothetical protein
MPKEFWIALACVTLVLLGALLPLRQVSRRAIFKKRATALDPEWAKEFFGGERGFLFDALIRGKPLSQEQIAKAFEMDREDHECELGFECAKRHDLELTPEQIEYGLTSSKLYFAHAMAARPGLKFSDAQRERLLESDDPALRRVFFSSACEDDSVILSEHELKKGQKDWSPLVRNFVFDNLDELERRVPRRRLTEKHQQAILDGSKDELSCVDAL